MSRRACIVAALLLGACACRRGDERAESKGDAPEKPTVAAATPVEVAAVERRTLSEIVTAPGKTSALAEQKVRAPFAGTLTELSVIEGDHVKRGQVIGSIIARDSEAALSGAREMVRQASTPAEKSDAERALALAEKNLVRRPLVAAWRGAVLTRNASAGDRVTEDQELLTIEDASSVVFVADVSQADLTRVTPGRAATIAIAGRAQPVPAVVHGLMPSGNAAEFTSPVRLDLTAPPSDLPLGLFGTARITVGEHPGATVVPDAAILRDDVSGVSRVAVVDGGRAHWIAVRTGLHDEGRTEIQDPVLPDGRSVIVGGLVGLPEAQPVVVRSAAVRP